MLLHPQPQTYPSIRREANRPSWPPSSTRQSTTPGHQTRREITPETKKGHQSPRARVSSSLKRLFAIDIPQAARLHIISTSLYLFTSLLLLHGISHGHNGRASTIGNLDLMDQGLSENCLPTSTQREKSTGQDRTGQGRAALRRNVCLTEAGLVGLETFIHAHICIMTVGMETTEGGKTAGDGQHAGAE